MEPDNQYYEGKNRTIERPSYYKENRTDRTKLRKHTESFSIRTLQVLKHDCLEQRWARPVPPWPLVSPNGPKTKLCACGLSFAWRRYRTGFVSTSRRRNTNRMRCGWNDSLRQVPKKCLEPQAPTVQVAASPPHSSTFLRVSVPRT